MPISQNLFTKFLISVFILGCSVTKAEEPKNAEICFSDFATDIEDNKIKCTLSPQINQLPFVHVWKKTSDSYLLHHLTININSNTIILQDVFKWHFLQRDENNSIPLCVSDIVLQDGIAEYVDNAFENSPTCVSNFHMINTGLKEIPTQLLAPFKYLVTLELQSQTISKIKTRAFSTLPDLRQITLEKCQIEVIESHAFEGLNDLTSLKIIDQKIKILQEYTFKGLDNLEELWLHKLPLESVEIGAIDGIPQNAELEVAFPLVFQIHETDSQGKILPSRESTDISDAHCVSDMIFKITPRIWKAHNLSISIDPINIPEQSSNPSLRIYGDLVCKNFKTIPQIIYSSKINHLGKSHTHLYFKETESHFKIPSDLFRKYLRQKDFNNTEGTEPLCIQGLSIWHVEYGEIDDNTFDREPGCLSTLSLDDNNLKEIPIKALVNLINLDDLQLQFNKFSIIKKDSFKGLDKLKYLNLQESEIESIEPFAFSGLDKLKVLKLGGNKFKEIQEDTFSDLPALYKLDIQNMYIPALQAESFKGIKSTAEITASKFVFTSVKINFNVELPSYLQSILPESSKSYIGIRNSSQHMYFNFMSRNPDFVKSNRQVRKSLQPYTSGNFNDVKVDFVGDIYGFTANKSLHLEPEKNMPEKGFYFFLDNTQFEARVDIFPVMKFLDSPSRRIVEVNTTRLDEVEEGKVKNITLSDDEYHYLTTITADIFITG